MDPLTRRSFIKTSATAALAVAAAPLLRSSWFTLRAAESAGYFEREFAMSDALCEKVLAKALSKGGDFADLYFEHTISNYVILEDGKVNRAYSDVALGVGIRTVKGDQVGYGYTQELEEKSMLAAASTAATIASAQATKPAGQFIQLKTDNYYPLERLLTAVPLESKLPLVQLVNDTCFALSPLIVKVNATLHDQQKRILVVGSDGTKAEGSDPAQLSRCICHGRKERQAGAFRLEYRRTQRLLLLHAGHRQPDFKDSG